MFPSVSSAAALSPVPPMTIASVTGPSIAISLWRLAGASSRFA
jgi:hypothetical protein